MEKETNDKAQILTNQIFAIIQGESTQDILPSLLDVFVEVFAETLKDPSKVDEIIDEAAKAMKTDIKQRLEWEKQKEIAGINIMKMIDDATPEILQGIIGERK